LIEAFVSTGYRLLTEPMMALRIGQVYPELDACAGQAGWAIITAYNPAASMQSAADNRRAQHALIRRVSAIQTGPVLKTVHVACPPESWPDEPGVLLAIEHEDQAHALARDFNQAAIVVGRPGEATQLWWYAVEPPVPAHAHVRWIKPCAD
ncbi:MAG: DUF3293 domain-containing protein, partial [Pseudomonadota bacterium]